MVAIPVKSYPPERTYRSASAAIAGAAAHPLQDKAQADAKQLEGTSLINGFWTLQDFVLQFSGDKWLHVFVQDKLARWTLAEKPPLLDEAQVEGIGALPILLDWGGTIGNALMDRSTLLAKRCGAEFRRLWVNEGGFLVYTHSQLILHFGALCRTDTGEDVLYVGEYD